MLRIIFIMEDLKARGEHGRARLVARMQIGQSIAAFQPVADADMLRVRRVKGRRHDPFAETEDGAGFQDARDSGIHFFKGGCVDGGFDGVGGVERG